MKGTLFNHLEQMVEESFGLNVWDKVLQAANDEGVYVSSEVYPDERLIALVNAIHDYSKVPVPALFSAFGAYMFPLFIHDNPMFVKPGMTLKEFLLTVDKVIHVEVRKLHPDANTPEFSYSDEGDQDLIMYYSSPRRMCHMAEGLIAGAAQHFETSHTLKHDVCMHQGAGFCELHVVINSN